LTRREERERERIGCSCMSTHIAISNSQEKKFQRAAKKGVLAKGIRKH